MTIAAQLLPLYHRLPYAGRCLVAHLHGLQLRAWRYGRDTEELVSAASARDAWQPEDWQRYHQPRLRALLDRAATRVPYYRDAWQKRRFVSWRALANWPVLHKEDLRRHNRRLLADDRDEHNLFHEHTSGTTGTPVTLFHHRDTLRHWYALFEARARRWYGVDRTLPWAILGGQLVAPPRRQRPPFWVWNRSMRQLYLSSYHLGADTARHYVEALHRHHVCYLLGYPSMLAALAFSILDQRLLPPALRVVITNAEPLLPGQRSAIAEAFGCPVRETYGLAELTAAASECEAGRLHLWPEVGIVEVSDQQDQVTPQAGEGRLVSTGLLNTDQPLIRYSAGDLIHLAPAGERCASGRTLPLVRAVEGRCDDVLRTPDGRVIGRLDPAFKGEWPIREAQVRQERHDLVRVVVVPGPGFARVHEAALVRELSARLGALVTVEVELVDEIPRGKNGKFQAVVSLLERRTETNG